MNRIFRFGTIAALLFVTGASCSWAQVVLSPNPAVAFLPFERWRSAVLAGDAAALKGLYSADPAAQIRVNTVMHDAEADTSFWLGLKASNMKVEFIRQIVHPDRASLIFRADVASGLPNQQ